MMVPDAVVWSTFEDICVCHNHSLRDAVDTSGYQECHWTEGLLSFPEEVRTDKCSARIGHWQQTEYTVLSNCNPISEFVEVSGVWVRGGLTSTGVIRSDSAAASLKRPQPGEDSWKLKQSGSHRVRQSPSLPPSSPSRFYKHGNAPREFIHFLGFMRLRGLFPSLNEPSSRMGMF